MNLKAFHIVFMTFCGLLSLLCVGLGGLQFFKLHNITSLLGLAVSVAMTVGVISYSRWFMEKMKRMETRVAS